jgi:hypothetical protein
MCSTNEPDSLRSASAMRNAASIVTVAVLNVLLVVAHGVDW